MKTTYDVKNIFDIPNFARYANKKFDFQAYDQGDNTLMYEYLDKDLNLTVTVDFIVEKFMAIFRIEKLTELATMDNIEFFQMNFREGISEDENSYIDGNVDSFFFRPHFPENEKTYMGS